MHFGSTLRILRVDAGLSLRALARKVGVSSAYLSRVENGRDPAPTPDRLMAIAGALEVPPETLVELAHQTGAALADYVERVPAANAFFLEVARRDLDAAQLARLREVMDTELAPPDPEPSHAAPISALVGPRFTPRLRARRIDDIIEAGTARCVAGTDMGAAEVARKIREREAVSPTALGRGVAVPHAIVPGMATRVALVTLARPLPVVGPDGVAVDTAFVLVSGEGGRRHLEVLAQIARLATHGIARALASVTTARQARRVLERIEAA